MKILQAAKDLDYHMINLSKAIIGSIGAENFKYAVLNQPEAFRMHMGFKDNYDDEPWIINAYSNKFSYQMFERWFNEADVVLFCERTLFTMAEKRIKNNKLTFYFSERWWKPPIGKFRLMHPKFINLAIRLRRLSKNNNFHYLAQGGYAGEDLKFIGKFGDRIWNWGYFTDITEHPLTSKSIIKKGNVDFNILWCGRLLKWKRVDTLIKAFAITIKKNPRCHLTIIGNGSEYEKLISLAKRLLPDNSYSFEGLYDNTAIRETMNYSDIYVLTSNGYEGWGAVLNEAMAESCVVVATVESGGGRAIISDMKNGLLFSSGQYKSLSNKLSTILEDNGLMHNLKTEAKQTINMLWSPETAADRFLIVCNALLNNTEIPVFSNGPMKCENITKR